MTGKHRRSKRAPTDLVEDIQAELVRLRATSADVGYSDSIGATDERGGWISLGSSTTRHDFYWYGRQEELLERLRELPDEGGPSAVRDEFQSHFPGFSKTSLPSPGDPRTDPAT